MSSLASTVITSTGDGDFSVDTPAGFYAKRLGPNTIQIQRIKTDEGSPNDHKKRPSRSARSTCRNNATSTTFCDGDTLEFGRGGHCSSNDNHMFNGNTSACDPSVDDGSSDARQAPRQSYSSAFDSHGYDNAKASRLMEENRKLRKELATASSMLKSLTPVVPHYTAHLDDLLSSRDDSTLKFYETAYAEERAKHVETKRTLNSVQSELVSTQACLRKSLEDYDTRVAQDNHTIGSCHSEYGENRHSRETRRDSGIDL